MPAELHRKKGSITAEVLKGLLAWLDPDMHRAAEKYELLHRKLTKFFGWRNCHLPEEYADRVIDTVASKIVAGEGIRTGEPYLYFHGVALNLLKEYFRLDGKRIPFDSTDNIASGDDPDNSTGIIERQQDCLERLEGVERDLLVRYYNALGPAKRSIRMELAKQTGITENALRIKIHRIREGLRDCVDRARTE